MLSINPKEIEPAKLQGYLQSAVAPRPIAFASTLDENGTPNLSPFSFFNVFSSNPPILIFSPARRVRNNTVKHTLINVQNTKEVVINIVNYDIVQQMSLSSTEYPDGVNVEFVEFLPNGELKMRVHERGVGETKSCGTGTCAVALAATLSKGKRLPSNWIINPPGGRLSVEIDSHNNAILTGPAILISDFDLSKYL